jgi:hypothetical protein
MDFAYSPYFGQVVFNMPCTERLQVPSITKAQEAIRLEIRFTAITGPG